MKKRFLFSLGLLMCQGLVGADKPLRLDTAVPTPAATRAATPAVTACSTPHVGRSFTFDPAVVWGTLSEEGLAPEDVAAVQATLASVRSRALKPKKGAINGQFTTGYKSDNKTGAAGKTIGGKSGKIESGKIVGRPAFK